MMKKMLTAACQALLMAAIVFAATSAHARNPEEEAEKAAEKAEKTEHYKLYVKAGGGYNKVPEQSYGTQTASFVGGYGIEGAIGYKLKRWRIEGELSYRENNIDLIRSLTAAPNVGTPGGDLSSTAFMLNGYYDIPTRTGIKPYIGLGIGYAHVSAQYFDGPAVIQDHDSDVFAYQGIVGSNFNISENFALFGEYKYFATDDIDIDPAGTPGAYDNHSFLFGIKYNFY